MVSRDNLHNDSLYKQLCTSFHLIDSEVTRTCYLSAYHSAKTVDDLVNGFSGLTAEFGAPTRKVGMR